jgi:geranylgeranyl pyrophosphate synthase
MSIAQAAADRTVAADELVDAELARMGPRLGAPVHRLRKGGKRTRARLVELAAAATAAPPETTTRVSAVTELVHLASLVHDDTLDGAGMRRGVPTINAREGLPAAVLTGDALLAAAFAVAAPLGGEMLRVVADAVVAMCSGVAEENAQRYRADVSVEALLEVATLKTATLIAAACELSALAAGCSASTRRAFADFGRDFGTAVQLVDDVLDVTSSAGELGKPVASDFGMGQVTLPALPALHCDRRVRSLLRPGLSVRERQWVAQTIRDHGGHLMAMSAARAFATRAARRLDAGHAACRGRTPSAAAAALAEPQRLPDRYLAARIEQADARFRHELRGAAGDLVSTPPHLIADVLRSRSESSERPLSAC